MNKTVKPEDYPYLPVGKGNSLVLTRSDNRQRKGMDNDDDYIDELNSEGEIVAKYHSWHHMSIYPPQNVDEGWEKFDMSGSRIDHGPKRKK